MRKLALRHHLLLLCCFAVLAVGLWMLPVLFAGFPYRLSGLILEARSFAETGLLGSSKSSLVLLFFSFLHSCVSWQDVNGWTLVGACAMALALFPWWWSVYRLFDERMAWVSTVIFALMPMYWIEAVRLSGYTFSFFFLFLSFATYIELRERNRIIALIVSALCFGAALACKDAYITFLPWMFAAYIWFERKQWKRACAEVLLFGACAYVAFTLPLLPNALQEDQSLMDRAAVFLSPMDRQLPGTGHLYPDDYTYEFDREAFETRLLSELEESSFLRQRQGEHVRILFGVGEGGFIRSLINSGWMFVHAMPYLFLQDTVGGIFLWLFIIPGAIWFFFTKRKYFYVLCGLWLSMEVILRFFLRFARDHLMDIGWILALFSASGIVSIAVAWRKQWKLIPVNSVILIIVLVTGMQLVQANRKQFAHLYGRSNVPDAYAAAHVLAELPDDAVVAHPRQYHLFFFSDRNEVSIHRDTVDRLSEEGRLRDPFKHYGVTHIIGYSPEQSETITTSLPRIKTVSYSAGDFAVPLTPFLRYVLHIVR